MWITVASPKRPLIAKQPDFDARRGACRDAQATDCGGRTALRRFFARHNISFKKESLRAAGHRDRELIRCEASRMVKNSSGARYPFTALRGGNNARATPSLAALHRPLECPCPEGTAGDCPSPDDSARHGNGRRGRFGDESRNQQPVGSQRFKKRIPRPRSSASVLPSRVRTRL